MLYDYPNSSGIIPVQGHHQRTSAGHALRRREQLGPWHETGEILPARTAPQKRPPPPWRLWSTKPLPRIGNPRSITTSCSLSSGHLPAMPPAQITPPNAAANAARLTIDLPLHTEIRP